ncbi:MAG: hypothetical protein FWE62_07040, partial [Firmicutes bacterium]|nr:hypothetical protein [Bacillota bacterium]
MEKIFEKAQWIWIDKGEPKPNAWACFRAEAMLNECQSDRNSAFTLRVAVETKYWLTVNGELAVFDGGLFRESTPGNGYYDEIDIGKFIKSGANVFEFRVWYFGNGGRNNVRLGAAGLIFECSALGLYSGAGTDAAVMVAHYTTADENPSYIHGGHNIGYDARAAGADKFAPAAVLGGYGIAPFNGLERRPVPMFRFYPVTEAGCERCEAGKYIVKLPYAMQFTPWLRVRAAGGERIDMRSDRYIVPGGPSDHHNRYPGHRAEYICRAGVQEFESPDWIFGEESVFTVPDGVEILALGYRESRYDTDIKPICFTDNRAQILYDKAARTLLCCMRENFMDCPDRERGQWIGDVSQQSSQVFYALGESAAALLKKAIRDFIRLRKGDALVGNVPGENFIELPAQSLNAISEVGMIANYYEQTKDKDLLREAFAPMAEYLKLWEIRDGLVVNRRGHWPWIDHNFNV